MTLHRPIQGNQSDPAVPTMDPEDIKALRACNALQAIRDADPAGDVGDVIMPSGRRLRDSTREEMLAVAERLERLADRMEQEP